MKIMVGYDQSSVAKEALKLAKKHAKAFDAKVYVVRSLAQSREMKREDIQRLSRNLKKSGGLSGTKALNARPKPSSARYLQEKIWFNLSMKEKLMKSL